MKRAFVLLLDSFGIGFSKDANNFGDQGSDTFGHIAEHCEQGLANNDQRQGALRVPNLSKLGLTLAHKESTGKKLASLEYPRQTIGAYAHAKEVSSGKDTPSGHWEIAGVPVLFDWGYFLDLENTFPTQLTDRILQRFGLTEFLGNCHASGTQIINELGQEHMKTGKPIFYTSDDSVFQIACHEETFGLDRLYQLCEIAREELDIYGKEQGFQIGRVIARPFVGDAKGNFVRTGNRHDYSIKPHAETILQKLVAQKNGEVVSIGKIADIYAHTGITKKRKATGLTELFDVTLEEIKLAQNNTIVFTNFVDFDSSYGHRRDVAGYASAIEYFDSRINEVLDLMQDDDILILTADHGCDPSWHGTGHTREHIPILLYSKTIPPGSLGFRDTFADIGQTLANYFGVSPMRYGVELVKFN